VDTIVNKYKEGFIMKILLQHFVMESGDAISCTSFVKETMEVIIEDNFFLQILI